MDRPSLRSSSSVPSRAPRSVSVAGVLALIITALTTGCVIDRTGQSRTLSLQQDLAQTHAQVQALKRQMDDQLNRTSARLVEVEENAQLSQRNVADSSALLDTLVSELQALRGTFEEMNQRVAQSDRRGEKFQEDFDFRFQEFEKRLVALEKSFAALPPPSAQAQAGTVADAVVEEPTDKLSADDTLKKAKSYYEGGNYKTALAFLRGFKKRFPSAAAGSREEAQYLLAESLFRDGDHRAAIKEFQVLLDDFPKTARLGTAMLRQGEAFQAMGEKEDASVFYNEIIRAFPRSPEAETARNHLKEIKP